MALVDAHGAAVMALLRRLCGNVHDAEDVFQETAVRVWRNFSLRPWLINPRGWLMTIAYRTFLDSCVRRKATDQLGEAPDPASRSPAELAAGAEESDRVQSAIASLSPAMREVVLLHYVGGLSLSRTAEAMEISEGTVKSRLNAALATMRRVLE